MMHVHAGQLKRAAVELAKLWRLDKYLRRLDVCPNSPYDHHCCPFCISRMHRLHYICFSTLSCAAWDAGHNGGG